ncbi:MAG TPA: MucB/RseB C-terminal domain-containing protein [Burkholderiales bacterium]|jgi:sigma-E factor negative regulatory protein RseB|nr:MucB/RseB C-terminal domain-containing protein [Burkholderiales bacterium]
MRSTLPAFLVLLGSIGHADWAGAQNGPNDAMAWLKKIASASRQINYAGNFVYQHGNQVETSRIAHWADASGEYEKLETLDGPSREIVRNNDNVTCYLPESKTVVIEKRTARQFPALLPEQLSGISDNYIVKKGEHDRVAGFDCQVIVLESKDNLRYGHKFCAEITSGLPLRARTFNDKNEMVESFAFTQLKLGSGVTKDMLRSRYAGKSQAWRVDKSALEQNEASADSGWVLKNQPAGFKKLNEMKRTIAGRSTPVSHIVYSDGLAAISVFIEPMPKLPPPAGPTYQGAVNIYVRSQADQMVTVVGETPARTVKLIAESLGPRAP